jgi:NAD(P)-dependent dehydrogenase (short-subunit alcohol dehydrogenase family)
MATKIVLILGASGNIGSHVAKKFASEGYKVAVASRRGTSADPAYLPIKANLSSPGTVNDVFEQVKKGFGAVPNVVVYNGMTLFIPRFEATLTQLTPNSAAFS